MLVTMKEILADARNRKYAVGAFNVPNLESIRAVTEAAEELGLPVILAHAEVHESLIPLREVGPIMLDYARRASVPVCVHLDHGASFEACMEAIRGGFTSIMFDASDKPYEENLEKTREITKIAHAVGVSVEAELGSMFNSAVGGGEGREVRGREDFASEDDCYTNPEQARQFVEGTGVDALAVAFGTSHGVYLTAPRLDLDRVARIRDAAGIPLVMHGGSGVSEENFKKAIANGITKINYYTYSSMAGAGAVQAYLDSKKGEKVFFHDMALAAQAGIKEDVKAAMKIFASSIL